MVTFSQTHARGSVAGPGALIDISADDASVTFSDYAGTLTRAPLYSRITRPIVDGNGFEHLAPGARARFAITLPTGGMVATKFRYTGLATRTDVYNDAGVLLVDGVEAATFTCPNAWTGGAHPVGNRSVKRFLLPGAYLFEALLPYGASIDFKGLVVPSDATFSAPAARPDNVLAVVGDSIPHGYNGSRADKGWAMQLAQLRGETLKNLANGGREIVATDGTALGNVGAPRNLMAIGFNNFYAQTPIITFRSRFATALTNFRAANPTGLLEVVVPIASTFPAPGAISLEDYRQAQRDEVAALADAGITIIEGGAVPDVSGLADTIHPNDAGAAQIATYIDGEMA